MRQLKFLRLRFRQVREFVFFLPFHASILEPDFDLSFREVKRVRDLDASATGEVAVEVKFLLQLERLVPRVGGARALRLDSIHTVCRQRAELEH